MLNINKVFGTLAGVAYGDAFGMPVEFWSRKDIQQRFPDGINQFLCTQKKDLHDDFRFLKKYEVTDDTLNTILVAQLMSDKGKINSAEYIELLNDLSKTTDISVIAGPSTLSALKAIKSGADIQYTGRMGTTNGALMKLSPIGILFGTEQVNELVTNVRNLCAPTHNTKTAILASVIIARIISLSVRTDNPEQFVQESWAIVSSTLKIPDIGGFNDCQPDVETRLNFVQSYMKTHDKFEVFKMITNLLGTGVESIDTLIVVLVILSYTHSPIEASRIAVTLGGDTDTAASIVCSILGGLYPIEFLDNNDIKQIESVNNIDLMSIAQKLVEREKNEII